MRDDIVSIKVGLWVALMAGLGVLSSESSTAGEYQCTESQFLNFDVNPPVCQDCKVCSGDVKYTIVPCRSESDTKCSHCPPGWFYDEVEAVCEQCCACTKEHQPQQICVDAGRSQDFSCLGDEGTSCELAPPELPWLKVHWYYLAIAGSSMVIIIAFTVVLSVWYKRRNRKETSSATDQLIHNDGNDSAEDKDDDQFDGAGVPEPPVLQQAIHVQQDGPSQQLSIEGARLWNDV